MDATRPSTGSTPDLALSVNELLERDPGAVAVLNDFGIDTCCGGGLPLAAAAEDAGVDTATLLRALEERAGA